MSADGEKITTTHIPAFPGWSVGTPQVDDQFLTDAVWWEPVIAWVVRTSEMKGEPTYSWADPVSIGRVSACKRYVIRSPDGIIDEPEAGRHANDDCVVSHWREQDIRIKAIRAAKAANERQKTDCSAECNIPAPAGRAPEETDHGGRHQAQP